MSKNTLFFSSEQGIFILKNKGFLRKKAHKWVLFAA
jgi:hypothetical protein